MRVYYIAAATILVPAGLILSGMGQRANAASATATVSALQIETVSGSSIKRLTLNERAARRLDIQTSAVKRDESGAKVVPYAAIIYDKAGLTWVYMNPEPMVFMRHQVTVARIIGPDAILDEGPSEDAKVVIVGVSELYGAEIGIGK